MNVTTMNNTHQLIQRQQNYVMERKLISIHTEDRDIKKWPNSNHFEVTLPEPVLNVQSMRLLDILVPVNFYTFSNTLQNTKMFFSVIPTDDISLSRPDIYADLSNSVLNPYEITIQEGFYAASELAIEIENRMNSRLQLIDLSYSSIDPSYVAYNYNFFKSYYDNVSQKIWIGNQKDGFNLEFQKQSFYDLPNNENIIDWTQYTKWGLGFYLGYDRIKYTSTPSSTNVYFHYAVSTDSAGTKEHKPYTWLDINAVGTLNYVYYIKPPYILKINGDKCIYMELNKYNSYDELYPFSQSTNSVLNNDFGGKANSAFAKIMITTTPFNESFESSNGFLNNMSFFNPPMERLSKLEFKFRYHNGRLVDFQKYPFHFTIEVNSLRNEIAKTYNVRTPSSF
jgi:hypothetical protein